MGQEIEEIKVIGVNKEGIKVSSDKGDFWVVPFMLSPKPDQAWERKFYDVQQRSNNVLKRKTHVVDGCINTEVASMDDLQKILDVIKVAVAETNVLCEADNQKKIKIRQEVEALQQRQRDATQKFKDAADKLTF